MKQGLLVVVGLLAFAACTEQVEETSCQKLCKVLYQECEYAAFPSFESCEQGCLYDTDEGGDPIAQLGCVEEAQCDTFAIVDCAQTYGATSDD